MSIKIDRFKVKDKTRGRAKVLASFDVNMGPITVRGFDLIQAGNNVFISEPHNYWKDDSGEGHKFNYLVYNGPKGQKLREQIEQKAKEEYKRRRKAPEPEPQPQSDDPFGDSGGFFDDDEDDLPF